LRPKNQEAMVRASTLALTMLSAVSCSGFAATGLAASGRGSIARLGAAQLATRTGAVRRLGLRGGGEKMGVGERCPPERPVISPGKAGGFGPNVFLTFWRPICGGSAPIELHMVTNAEADFFNLGILSIPSRPPTPPLHPLPPEPSRNRMTQLIIPRGGDGAPRRWQDVPQEG